MLFVVNIIAPVFAIVAIGFVATRIGLFPRNGVRGLIAFVNTFATPALLFRTMLEVEFSSFFDIAVIGPFYIGALVCFALGILISRKIFLHRPGHSVICGFSASFTNTVLLGIPIVHRAWGDEALVVVFSIISLHAAIMFSVAVITMEVSRRDGATPGQTALRVGRGLVGNALLWGVALGVLVNISGLELPETVDSVTGILAASVIPVALFGLGAALNEYKLRSSWVLATMLTGVKLVVHPLIVWVLMVPLLGAPMELVRPAVLLSAMPAGLNSYIFATYYKRSTSVAANSVLISTVLGLISISVWLVLLS
ncbi:MAG: AEC family transporter [Alphaproteobacteria bacterium]|nr:AEC family transporter [Alphaproteobacteria bacterium]